MVSEITNHGKFFTVTYESWDLSWTTGLPLATIPSQYKRDLTLGNDKVYISYNDIAAKETAKAAHFLGIPYVNIRDVYYKYSLPPCVDRDRLFDSSEAQEEKPWFG